MKRFLLVSSLLTVAALLLGACGGAAEVKTSPTSATAAPGAALDITYEKRVAHSQPASVGHVEIE